MRFPSVLYLLPSIVPQPQSPPTPAGNVQSSTDILSPPPVALGLSQLTPDPVLTCFPARAVSSDSPLDTSALPGSAVASALNSPNGETSGTFHLRDAIPNPSGVCQGLIEDLDITGLGERQQPSRYTNFVWQGIYRCPNNVLCDKPPHRSDSWTSPYSLGVAWLINGIFYAVVNACIPGSDARGSQSTHLFKYRPTKQMFAT